MDLFSIKMKELEFLPTGFVFCSICKFKKKKKLPLLLH